MVFCGYFVAETKDDFFLNKLLVFGWPLLMLVVFSAFRREPRPFPVAEEQTTPSAGDGATH